MALFMEHTDPRRLASCIIASGDVLRPKSQVVSSLYDFCVAVCGPEVSVEYIRQLFGGSDISGLAPEHRRIIEQPTLDHLGLTEDGRVDRDGRLVTDEWYRMEHDRCKKSGWGYAPRAVNYELSPELGAELEELRRPRPGSQPSTKEKTMGQRDVCGKCGITRDERLRQWNAPAPPGVVKIGNGRGAFMYCEHCQKGICGGCSIDLGMTAGCPLCRMELVYMDGGRQ